MTESAGARVQNVSSAVPWKAPLFRGEFENLRDETAKALNALGERLSALEARPPGPISLGPTETLPREGLAISASSAPPPSPAADVDGLAREMERAFFGRDGDPIAGFKGVARHVLARERGLREEIEKWRTAARVQCGAHIGVQCAECPTCRAEKVEADLAAARKALEEERQKFQQETRRTSEQAVLLRRIADEIVTWDGAPGDFTRRQLAREIGVLLAKPINAPQEPAPAEPSAEEVIATVLAYTYKDPRPERAAAEIVDGLRARGLLAREPRVEVEHSPDPMGGGGFVSRVLLNGFPVSGGFDRDEAARFAANLRAALRGGA